MRTLLAGLALLALSAPGDRAGVRATPEPHTLTVVIENRSTVPLVAARFGFEDDIAPPKDLGPIAVGAEVTRFIEVKSDDVCKHAVVATVTVQRDDDIEPFTGKGTADFCEDTTLLVSVTGTGKPTVTIVKR